MKISTSQKREQLLETEKMHKRQLEGEFENFARSARDTSIKAAAIGTTLLLAYVLVKKMLPKSEVSSKKIKQKTKVDRASLPTSNKWAMDMGSWITKELSMWLLSVAKKRLIEFINELNAQKKHEHIKNT